MRELIEHIQQRLAAATFPAGLEPERKNNRLFEYVDIDWGQVDFYGDHPPVKFPCALIDIADATYSNEGKRVQLGIINIQIRVLEMVLSNSSAQAPQGQKNKAFRVLDLVNETHRQLHCWTGDNELFGPLTRVSLAKVNRPDGIKEYQLVYQVQLYDNSAERTHQMASAMPQITVKLAKNE